MWKFEFEMWNVDKNGVRRMMLPYDIHLLALVQMNRISRFNVILVNYFDRIFLKFYEHVI